MDGATEIDEIKANLGKKTSAESCVASKVYPLIAGISPQDWPALISRASKTA